MKKIISFNVLFVFLLFLVNGIQAQTQEPKLDQFNLIRQFVGNWKMEYNKDTTFIIEVEQCGKTILETDYLLVNGKKEFDSKWTYGYSPETNQFKIFAVYPDGRYNTWIGYFSAEKMWQQILVQDMNPEKIIMKAECNFLTPDEYSAYQMDPEGKRISRDFSATKIKE